MVCRSRLRGELMRLTDEDLKIIYLAVSNHGQEEGEGATASQDYLNQIEKLSQKIMRERVRRGA